MLVSSDAYLDRILRGLLKRREGAGGYRVNPPDTFILCPSGAILIRKILFIC
jgi:hypothetical protein